MPVISLPYTYLEQLVGTDRETILSRIPMFGADIERIEDDHADIEFFPNRPDLFSTEGVARAMRGFLDIERGLAKYKVSPSSMRFSIDPGLAEIRPYLGSAVIRNVALDDDAVQSLMGLQEALHWAVGRGRSKVAIGIHDLDTITPPFHYLASPRDRAFVPLDFDHEMTLDEILTDHPKGRDYAHVVDRFPKFPLIVDANDNVLSFPPIINGELTRVTTETSSILLDTTGTDGKAVQTAVNILCTAFAEMGASIESVLVEEERMPTLEPSTRSVSVEECNRVLGLDLTAGEIAERLLRMRFGAEPVGTDRVTVEVPCYRADILHDWDIFEDVAIAYGYENITPLLPATFTVAQEHPAVSLMATVRSILVGLGFIEIMPFTLTNERILFGNMNQQSRDGLLRVLRPISEEQTLVRTSILPLLMETLQLNRHRELPQRLFGVGDVVEDCCTFQKIAAVTMHPEADFSEIYAVADVVCRELGLSYAVEESSNTSFIDGRRGDIFIDGKKAGMFGEIHPVVLTAFELDQPVAGFELDLRAVRGYLSQRDTP